MQKSRPKKYLSELSNTNRNIIKSLIQNKEVNFESLLKNESLIETQSLLKITTESILYACTYNNVKVLNEIKYFIENKHSFPKNEASHLNKDLFNNVIYLHSAIHNKSHEALNFLLKVQNYTEEQMKDGCAVAVKFNNLPALEKIHTCAKEKFNMNLNFNNKLCMRLAINNRSLDTIKFLSDNGVSPFNVQTNKHLLDIIKRDDEDWLNFYLKNNIIQKEHLMNKNMNLLHKLMLFEMNKHEKYKKGFFYAQKIIDYFISKEDNVKELVSIFKSIPIYYPQSEGKIIEFKNSLKAAILYKHINQQVVGKSLFNTQKRNKI